MKTVKFIILALVLAFSSCTKEYEYPEKEVRVSLEFDKFYQVKSEQMTRVASTPYSHIIHDGIADVTLFATDPLGNNSNQIYHKEMNRLGELVLNLNVGWTYRVEIFPAEETIPETDKLVFYGSSEVFVAVENQNTVLINVNTSQALVIIENVNMESPPQVEFYSDNTYTTLLNTYGVGLNGDWYGMYVVDLDKGYRFIIPKVDGTTAYVKIFNLDPGMQYTILPSEITETDGSLEIDIDGSFTNQDITV